MKCVYSSRRPIIRQAAIKQVSFDLGEVNKLSASIVPINVRSTKNKTNMEELVMQNYKEAQCFFVKSKEQTIRHVLNQSSITTDYLKGQSIIDVLYENDLLVDSFKRQMGQEAGVQQKKECNVSHANRYKPLKSSQEGMAESRLGISITRRKNNVLNEVQNQMNTSAKSIKLELTLSKKFRK